MQKANNYWNIGKSLFIFIGVHCLKLQTRKMSQKKDFSYVGVMLFRVS